MSKAVAVQTRSVDVTGEVGFISKAVASRPIDADTFDRHLGETLGLSRQVKAADDLVMWNLATLTYNAISVAGTVGGATVGGVKVKADDPGVRWANQQAYGDALGFSKGYVSRLVGLGRAAMVHGIREGSAQWTYLCSHASDAPFGKLLRGDDTDALKAALKAALAGKDPKAAIAPATREAQPDDGSGSGAESGAESGEETPKTYNYRDMLTVLRGVEEWLHTEEADKGEGRDKVHAAMLRIVAADRKRIDTLAKAEAKRAAAEAPVEAAPEEAPVEVETQEYAEVESAE